MREQNKSKRATNNMEANAAAEANTQNRTHQRYLIVYNNSFCLVYILVDTVEVFFHLAVCQFHHIFHVLQHTAVNEDETSNSVAKQAIK